MAFKQGVNLTFTNGSAAVAGVVEYGENENGNVQEECTSDTGGEMQGAEGPISRELTLRIAKDDLPSGFDVNSVVAIAATTDGTVAGVTPGSYIVKTRGKQVATKGIIYQTFNLGIAQA